MIGFTECEKQKIMEQNYASNEAIKMAHGCSSIEEIMLKNATAKRTLQTINSKHSDNFDYTNNLKIVQSSDYFNS